MRIRLFVMIAIVLSLLLMISVPRTLAQGPEPGGLGDPVTALQHAQNVELVGQIGGAAMAVAVQGNFAYVGVGPRLVILDISDPTSPAIVGQTNVFPHYAVGVDVVGSYAYVANGYSGLRIVDVSDSATPTEVGYYDTWYVSGVAVTGSFAYVADGDLRIVDISDPAAPTEVGFYSTPSTARDITVVENYVYIADGFSGLRIVDVSSPTSPTEVGSYDTPGHAFDVTLVGSYAYIADGSDGGLVIVNVSDPADPTKVGSYDTPGSAHGLAVTGNHAYIADGLSGVRVVDVINPAAPSEVSFYDTQESTRSVTTAEELRLCCPLEQRSACLGDLRSKGSK